MIELGIEPCRSAVAGGALLREAGGLVIGVLGAIKVLQVTAHAIGAGGGKIVVSVARRALQLAVRPGERESGKLRVVEFRSQPAIERVALLAICGKVDGCVIRITGFGIVS